MSDHNHDEAPHYDDINTPAIVIVGAISAVVTLLTIFFVQGLCYHWQNSFLTRRAVGPADMPAYQQIEEQKSLLSGEGELKSIDEGMSNVIKKFGK